MVLADRGRGFVQEIAAGVGDLRVDFLDFSLGFLPIIAEFLLVRHAPLVFGEFGCFALETVEWGYVTAIRKRGKPCDTKVDADSRGYWCSG